MIRMLLLVAAFLPFATPAMAQDPRLKPSADYGRCLASGDAARGKSSAIDVCIGVEMALQERRLADQFVRTSNQHGYKGQDWLRDQQGLWLRESAARCSARVAADPRPSLMSRTYNQCILDETLARIAWLEDFPPERAR